MMMMLVIYLHVLLICYSFLKVQSNLINNFNSSKIEDIETFLANGLPDFMFNRLLDILNVSSFSDDADNIVENMMGKGFGQVLIYFLSFFNYKLFMKFLCVLLHFI